MTESKRGFAFGFLAFKPGVTPAQFGSEYAGLVPATLTPYGGKFVCKCPTSTAAATFGEVRHLGYIIEFPSADAAASWFKSDAYQALVETRNALCDFICFVAEGTGVRASGDGPQGFAFGMASLKVSSEQIESEYTVKVAPTLAAQGGVYATKCPINSAVDSHGDVKDVGFILEFPSGEHARDWYHSAEYQSLVPQRTDLMDLTLSVCAAI